MPFYVYILRGATGTHYTGITEDFKRRFEEHQKGKSKSTRSILPVTVVWLETLPTRKEARALEVKIKTLGAKKWLQKVSFYKNIFF